MFLKKIKGITQDDVRVQSLKTKSFYHFITNIFMMT